MRKLIVLLVILLFTTPAFALEVGDKMPDVSGFKQQEDSKPWFIGGKSGNYVIRDNNPEGDDLSEYAVVVYTFCNGEQFPFPYGILFNMFLHLDLDYDRIIDKVIAFLPPKIGMLAPECP